MNNYLKKKFLNVVRKNKYTSKIVSLYSIGRQKYYLDGIGWIKSFRESIPVDKKGRALPWFTYSAISFLEKRVNSSMSVFEYGSGNSTIWWSEKAGHITSYEHSKKWYNEMKEKVPSNVKYIFSKNTSKKYSKVIKRNEEKYNIVVIDGVNRVDCAMNCIGALKNDGVIIWDDTHRKEYEKGKLFLKNNGFKCITFEGLKPTNSWVSETSIYYRSQNCLGI